MRVDVRTGNPTELDVRAVGIQRLSGKQLGGIRWRNGHENADEQAGGRAGEKPAPDRVGGTRHWMVSSRHLGALVGHLRSS